jgi:hypothetical protein
MVDKKAIDKAIEKLWSNYCDLDYWIEDMKRTAGNVNPNKWVLKMAMKHLRDDMYKLHDWACAVREENCDEY